MSWSVELHNRQHKAVVLPASLHFRPSRYGWSVFGGPDQAEIEVSGSPLDLWRLLAFLRFAVTIRNPVQEPVWWGYIDEVRLSTGAIRLGVALEAMYNRVAVAYSYVEPGSQSVGTRATTAWVQADDVVAEYGVKEYLASLDGATAEQAERARDAILAQHRLPVPVLESGGRDEPGVQLLCRGWWHTLNWRYYANGASNSVETTAQIAAIVGSVGEFLTGTDIVNASGISTSEYRDGDGTAMSVIHDLLRAGTANGAHLLTIVTHPRRLQVMGEPERGQVAYYLRADGRIEDRIGRIPAAGMIPVGRWIGLKDLLPNTAVGYMANPSPFFVERGEYVPEGDQLSLEPRGLPSPWEVAQVKEG